MSTDASRMEIHVNCCSVGFPIWNQFSKCRTLYGTAGWFHIRGKIHMPNVEHPKLESNVVWNEEEYKKSVQLKCRTWIRSYGIPLCSTHRSLIYISNFVEIGKTLWMDERTLWPALLALKKSSDCNRVEGCLALVSCWWHFLKINVRQKSNIICNIK